MKDEKSAFFDSVKSCLLRLGILLGIFAVLLWFALAPLGTRWPRIASPEKLREDAKTLSASLPEGKAIELPRADWPPTIAVLKPRAVFVSPNCVSIVISHGGASGEPWSYLVWTDNIERPGGDIEKYDSAVEQAERARGNSSH